MNFRSLIASLPSRGSLLGAAGALLLVLPQAGFSETIPPNLRPVYAQPNVWDGPANQLKFRLSLEKLVREHVEEEREKLKQFWGDPPRVVQAQRRSPVGPRDLQTQEPAHIPSLRIFGRRAQEPSIPAEDRP